MAQEEELKLQEQEQEQEETPTTGEEQPTSTTTTEEKSSTSSEESTTQKRTPITVAQIEAPQLKNNYEKYWMEHKNANPFNDEEYERRKRRARSAQLIGAIGDGISSLANLWGTTRYGKSAYTEKSPLLSDKAKKVYDEIEKERQTNKAAWQKGAENAAKLGAQYDKNNAKMQFDVANANIKNKLAADKIEAEQQNKDKESGAKVKKIESETENAANVAKSVVGKNEAQAAKAKAEAQKAYKEGQAAMIRAKKSGSKAKVFPLQTPSGTLYYETKEEYEQAVYAFAEAAGIPTTKEMGTSVRTTGKVVKNNKTVETTKEVRLNIEEVAGHIKNIPEEIWGEVTGEHSKQNAKKGKGYGEK